MECEHRNFQSFCNVHRLENDKTGVVERFQADVRIRCADCKKSFGFKTKNRRGLSLDDATTSIDDTELRIPIFPSNGLPLGVKKSPSA